MNHNRWTQVIAIVIAMGFLTIAGLLLPSINDQRADLGLTFKTANDEVMPPEVALATAALGTFRGLAVDVLWYRADKLQDEGLYFEADTLTRWITTLQPKYVEVWSFQAWNMSYNISAASQTSEERWLWVNNGIELLRDDAIRMNPDKPKLYTDISWIYFHKILGTMDRAHWTYKANLARDMQELLGDITTGKTMRESISEIDRIAAAPDTLEQLLEQQPRVQKLLDVMAEHELEPDTQFLRMLGRVVMFRASLTGTITGITTNKFPEGTNVEFIQEVSADRELAALMIEDLVPYLRKRALLDEKKLDPAYMAGVMEKYGPLDWRHPAAHGIYWSEKAWEVAVIEGMRGQVDQLGITRRRLHDLQELVQSGRLAYDPVMNHVDLMPDPRFIEPYLALFRSTIAKIGSEEGLEALYGTKATGRELIDGYENFLVVATINAYIYGDERQAAKYHRDLRTQFSNTSIGRQDQHTARNRALYQLPLEDFVAIKLGEITEVDSTSVRQFIDAMIRRGIFEGLNKNRLSVWYRFVSLAKRMYERNEDRALKTQTANMNTQGKWSFEDMVLGSYVSALQDPALPLIDRARIWALTEPAVQRRAWPRLEESFVEFTDSAGIDMTLAFPKPEGVRDADDAIDQAEAAMAERHETTLERK